MLNKIVSLLIVASALTVAAVIASPAQAQMIDEVQADQHVQAVAEYHGSRSGWEQPLVQKDQNLKHYYWTEIDRNKAAYKVINRTASRYNTVTHTASSKPVVLPPRGNKNISTEIRGSNNDVSGRVRPLQLAQARTAPAMYSYNYGNGYGRAALPVTNTTSSDKQCRAKLMSY